MEWAAILPVLILGYYVWQAFKTVDAKILELEKKLQKIELTAKYGEASAEGSMLEEAQSEFKQARQALAEANEKRDSEAIAKAKDDLEDKKEWLETATEQFRARHKQARH